MEEGAVAGTSDQSSGVEIVHLYYGDRLGDWTVKDKLGEGGFGAVYLVTNAKGEQYAMKTESVNASVKVLKAEYYVLVELKRAKAKHFCEILDSGLVGSNKYLVMTLVGQTLTDLRKHDPTEKIQKFTLGCALSVGIECLEAVEELHGVGYLHRDIKPGNFAIGKKNLRQIYLLDFGMCRRYLDKQGSTVRNPRRLAGFRGTVRYAPISCHISREQSRKDDLESWLYQQAIVRRRGKKAAYSQKKRGFADQCTYEDGLSVETSRTRQRDFEKQETLRIRFVNSKVELTVGHLPWKSMKDKDEVGRCKQLCRKVEYIRELFGGCPREYIMILRIIDSIRYYEKPDYARINILLHDAIRINDVSEYPYDWEKYLKPET